MVGWALVVELPQVQLLGLRREWREVAAVAATETVSGRGLHLLGSSAVIVGNSSWRHQRHHHHVMGTFSLVTAPAPSCAINCTNIVRLGW